MTLSVSTICRMRRILLLLFGLPFILLGILIFHQEHIQNFVLTSALYNITEQNNINKNVFNPHLQQPVSVAILRSILVFYSSDQEKIFLSELLWLYRSWVEMMKDESPLWRTDFIIYTGRYTVELQQLGCVYNRIRTDKNELPRCRIFPYQPVRIRNGNPLSHAAADHLHQQFDQYRSILLNTRLGNYDYIDSINIIAECYPSFAMYDYILRTDIDVFLTKNFGRFVPYNDILLVGRGAYSTFFTLGRLRRVARDMNWQYANITDVGSTWYGPPRIAQRIANFSLEAMLHLSLNEFTKPEREGRLANVLWPEWHYGVLSMYSTHLAVNHLLISEKLDIRNAEQLLDQSTTGNDQNDIEKNNRLHLHCWHTDQQFSKFQFKANKYNHIHPRTLLNDRSAQGYAMRMALESRLMSFGGLKQALSDVKKSSNF